MPSAADCRQYGDDDEEEIVKRRALTHIHTDTERRRFVIASLADCIDACQAGRQPLLQRKDYTV